jgi:hypothetical protein
MSGMGPQRDLSEQRVCVLNAAKHDIRPYIKTVLKTCL